MNTSIMPKSVSPPGASHRLLAAGLGISRLLSNDTYVAAYPLHDGRYDKDGPDGSICDRRVSRFVSFLGI